MDSPPSHVDAKPKEFGFDLQRVVWDPQYRKRVMDALKRKHYEERKPPRSVRKMGSGQDEE